MKLIQTTIPTMDINPVTIPATGASMDMDMKNSEIAILTIVPIALVAVFAWFTFPNQVKNIFDSIKDFINGGETSTDYESFI